MSIQFKIVNFIFHILFIISDRSVDQFVHMLVLRDPRIPEAGREDRRHSQKFAPATASL